jgi:ABC-type antimicrobial peptide transport system permease subunit
MQAGRVASGLTGTAEMLDALGIDLRQGRFFTPAEAESGAPVTVVSETLATRLFDSAAVVGRTMYIGAEPRTIIGVAADTDSISVGTRDYGTAYLPGMPDPRRSIVIVARSHTTGAAALRILQSTLRDLDPDLPVVEMVTGPQIIARQTMFERTAGALGGVLGYFALVLALAGASGLLSFTVASRRREIGIRRALGALNRHIVRLLALRMVVSVVAGALAGLVAGLMVAFLIGYVLNREVSVMPLDVTVVAGSLLAATLLAALMPLRRALRVDPATCLRD